MIAMVHHRRGVLEQDQFLLGRSWGILPVHLAILQVAGFLRPPIPTWNLRCGGRAVRQRGRKIAAPSSVLSTSPHFAVFL